jgi:polar amino acid transport system permease protein
MELGTIVTRLASGAGVTLSLTLAGCALATVLALLAGTARMSRHRSVRWFAVSYIEVARGASAYVQLFWLFFVLPLMGLRLTSFQAAALTLGLVSGAYGAEIVRGALQTVPKGQIEAAIALNLPPFKRFWRIILPQAFVATLPPMSNLYVQTLKATALASLVGLQDMTYIAQTLRAAMRGNSLPIYSVLLVAYLALALLIVAGMRGLERLARRRLGMGPVRA